MVLRLFVQPGMHSPTPAFNSSQLTFLPASGENKVWVTARRPEPLPGSATITNTLLTSNILALGYTTFARAHARNAGLPLSISTPALFLRTSARASIWCGIAGAAVTAYFHNEFTKPASQAMGVKGVEWKIWERTEKYTIDDGFLLGSAVGLTAGLVSSALLRRNPHNALRWYTRTAGCTSLGGVTGILASHAYFQYTGDRQKAVQVLEQWRKRRNIEFHHLYWKRLFFTTLSLPVQGYIMWNGVFRASGLPEEVADWPEKYGYNSIVDPWVVEKQEKEKESAEKKEQGKDERGEKGLNSESHSDKVDGKGNARGEEGNIEQNYFFVSEDYTALLSTLDPEDRLASIVERGKKRHILLKEADHVAYQISAKQYRLLHTEFAPEDADERQLLLREISIMMVLYNRLRADADMLGRGIHFSAQALRHHALLGLSEVRLEANKRKGIDIVQMLEERFPIPHGGTGGVGIQTWPSDANSGKEKEEEEAAKRKLTYPFSVEEEKRLWYPAPYNSQLVSYPNPIYALEEMDKIREEFLDAIRGLESTLQRELSVEDRRQVQVNLDEGRLLLRAADRVFWHLEREKKLGEAEREMMGLMEQVEEKVREQIEMGKAEKKKKKERVETMDKAEKPGKKERDSVPGPRAHVVPKLEAKGTTGTAEAENNKGLELDGEQKSPRSTDAGAGANKEKEKKVEPAEKR